MDQQRKKKLKKMGKAEVARQSAEVWQALKAANPVDPGDDAWAGNYKRGLLREKWLRDELPLLNSRQVEEWFVVLPNASAGWKPHAKGFVLCGNCGSVSPSAAPKRRFIYWTSCECGNIKWRCIGPWRNVSVARPESVVPVKLIGKG